MAISAVLLTSAGNAQATNATEVCDPAPRTGCSQSTQVGFKVRAVPDEPALSRLDWRWYAGEATGVEDYGDPTAATDYALCVYDGDATAQTESAAPAPGTHSLVLELVAPAGAGWKAGKKGSGYSYSSAGEPDGLRAATLLTGPEGGSTLTLSGRGAALGIDALDGVDRERVISQVQHSDGGCFGAAVSVELRNPPPFSFPGIPSDDVIDEAKAEALLDELAALYNRKLGDQAPLNMTLWSNALGSTEIQNLVVTHAPGDLDLQALSSGLYVFGWYGGTLFQRDGFQGNPGPAGPDNPSPAAFANAVNKFRDGIEVATTGSDQDVFDFLESADAGGPTGTGTGVRASVESYGYNTGYAYAVLEDMIDTFDPPDDKLVCSGITARTGFNTIHPKLPLVPADAPLFDCVFTPSFLEAAPALRPLLDEFLDPANPNVPLLPAYLQPAALKAGQDGQEGFGQLVWKVFLTGVILQDQAYRESLWDVDNAFLEVVEAAGLTGLGALARRDPDLGRQAVLAGGTVLEGWLAAYSFGLSAPSGPEPHDPATDPRVLPLFDLGTTPIE